MTTSAEHCAIHSVANVVIPVTDPDVAVRFYCDELGFEMRVDHVLGPDFRWIEVAPPGALTTIALATPRGGMWGPVGGDTNVNLACDDVAAEHARLRERGVDVDTDVLEVPGAPPMFRLRDPSGNVLQVVQSSVPDRGNG